MSAKRALIVGTSHSQGTCHNNNAPSISVLPGRWHDYLKTDHDYEVVNISRANCTTQQQLLAVLGYFADNPDEKFDLCIVEGRNLEATVSQPIPEAKNYFTNIQGTNVENQYYFWLDDFHRKTDGKKFIQQIGVMNAYDETRMPDYMPYYVDYTYSYQHAIDTWSCNLALCEFLNRYCNVVRWHTHSISKSIDNPDLDIHKIGWALMEPYCENFGAMHYIGFLPETNGLFKKPEDYCDCGHFNEKGHRKLWYNVLYPMYKEYV
jgi:hypothetical protein